jgi:hypothetical protein
MVRDGGYSCASESWLGSSLVLASLTRRRSVTFLPRSAGGRPTRGSEAQWHTLQTVTGISV